MDEPMGDLGPIQTKRLIRRYMELSRFLEAVVVAKKAIATFDPGHDYRVLLAGVYAAQGKTKRAVEELERVMAQDPENEEARKLLLELRQR